MRMSSDIDSRQRFSRACELGCGALVVNGREQRHHKEAEGRYGLGNSDILMMVKLKRNEERSPSQNLLMNSSDAATGLSLLGDWVIVKKQKVNILIPPLPGSSGPVACSPTSDQLQDAVLRELANTASDHPAEKGSEEGLVHGNDKPSPAAMENALLTARSSNPPNGVLKPINCRRVNLSQQKFPQMRDIVLRARKSTGAYHGFKTVKQSDHSDGPTMLSKTMKSSNIERKLHRAGGLSRWLTSLGLEQFIQVFHERRISKFQLANMSMRKLKDMGILEVGPRRKLMHAIECVCYPYCFEAL